MLLFAFAERLREKNLAYSVVKTELEELRAELDSLRRQDALDLIESYLHTGDDVAFSAPLQVLPNGDLSTWSSLRTFLIDYAGHRDREVARGLAQKVLDSSSSADEWAVAFQILDCERGQDLLAYNQANESALIPNTHNKEPSKRPRAGIPEKSLETILYQEAWINDPSDGYLMMYDYLRLDYAYEQIPRLLELAHVEGKVGRIASYTLQSMAKEAPETIMGLIDSQQVISEEAMRARALLYSSGDYRDPKQRERLVSYLDSPKVTNEEIRFFGEAYPVTSIPLTYTLRGGIPPTPTDHLHPVALSDARNKILEMIEPMPQSRARNALNRMVIELDKKIARLTH